MTISIDMDKAREIHRENIRRDRAPLMAALDVAYQRADEAGDSAAKADVVARKKVLRDLPADPRIDAAQTADDLLSVAIPVI